MSTEPIDRMGAAMRDYVAGYEEKFTLRDYFAAKAMQGIAQEIEDETKAARWCYEMADAMLKARKQ